MSTDKRCKENNWHTAAERKFYNGQPWKNLQQYCMRRDKYLCQDCLLEGKIQPAEVVHHLDPVCDEGLRDPERSKQYLDHSRCISLCEKHHRKRHREMKSKANRRYVVDPTTGDVKSVY